jgi:hypothetical protein
MDEWTRRHLIRAHETFEDLLKNQIPLPVIAEV